MALNAVQINNDKNMKWHLKDKDLEKVIIILKKLGLKYAETDNCRLCGVLTFFNDSGPICIDCWNKKRNEEKKKKEKSTKKEKLIKE